jgi:hypothetical protein
MTLVIQGRLPEVIEGGRPALLRKEASDRNLTETWRWCL